MRLFIEIGLTILTAKHLNNINNINKVIPLLKYSLFSYLHLPNSRQS